MLRYIGRRLLQTIPVFFGATFLIFAMVYLMPGDPVAALGGDRGLTEAAAAQIRAEYHLDQPFWMQYLLYLKGVFTLDFGKSFNQQPVIDVMARAFPTTIALAIYALAIESIFGITLGVIAGVRRGGWFDSTILVFSLLLISVPTFVLGFVLQFLLGFKLGVLPVTASASVNMASLTMPAHGPRRSFPLAYRHPTHPPVRLRERLRRLRAHRTRQGPDQPRRHVAPHPA